MEFLNAHSSTWWIKDMAVSELFTHVYEPINPFYHNSGEIVPSNTKRVNLRKKRKLKNKRK